MDAAALAFFWENWIYFFGLEGNSKSALTEYLEFLENVFQKKKVCLDGFLIRYSWLSKKRLDKNKTNCVLLWFAWAGVVLHFNREPQATNLLKWQLKKKERKKISFFHFKYDSITSTLFVCSCQKFSLGSFSRQILWNVSQKYWGGEDKSIWRVRLIIRGNSGELVTPTRHVSK